MTDTPAATYPDAPNAAPAAPPASPDVLPPLRPGWQTSEGWLSFATALAGMLPSSGLLDNAPVAVKVCGMIAAALATLGYQRQRTQLKRAHLAHAVALATGKYPSRELA